MKEEEVFDRLSRRGWLAATPSAFRTRFLDRCQIVHVRAGESIYRLEDSTGGLWGLAEGALHVETAVSGGPPRISFYVHPGFWTGLASIVFNARRQTGFLAARPSILAHLPRAEFDRLVTEDREAWRWLTMLATLNTATAIAVAHDLMIRDPRARAAALLLQLAECRTAAPETGPELLMSQDELAQIVNLSRSALSEILQEFVKAGWIGLAYRRLTIIQDEPLRTIANNH